MDDFGNQFIANTEKILDRLNKLDDKFSLLDNNFSLLDGELLELKWELDDIRKGLSSKPSTEMVKSKQVSSKPISIAKNK